MFRPRSQEVLASGADGGVAPRSRKRRISEPFRAQQVLRLPGFGYVARRLMDAKAALARLGVDWRVYLRPTSRAEPSEVGPGAVFGPPHSCLPDPQIQPMVCGKESEEPREQKP